MKTLEKQKKLYLKAKQAYYNKKSPLMSDADFDRLEDQIKKSEPNWYGLKLVGSGRKTKIALPYFMPSLAKAYPGQLTPWAKKSLSRTPKILAMAKLDGTSVMVVYKKGKPTNLYTRGNGETGKDISFLIPSLTLPVLKKPLNKTFRLEGVMSKTNFKKYALEFGDPRSMVNGLLNRKATEEPHKALKAIDFVVLGEFNKPMKESLDEAKQLGCIVVPHHYLTNNSKLESELIKIISVVKKIAYECDGLVICSPDAKMIYKDTDKPDWAIAFKVNQDEEAPEVKVKRIIWQVSHKGRVIPKVEIEPLSIDGVTVRHATAHNAKWMQVRNIGPGAIIKVLRSGGVIPKIVSVVKAGKFQPPECSYKQVGVHFVTKDDSVKRDIKTKEIVKFLNTAGIDFLALRSVEKLYDKGFTSTLSYCKLAKQVEDKECAVVDFGIGKVATASLLKEIGKLQNLSMLQAMVGSNRFDAGIGERKLKALFKCMPVIEFLRLSDAELAAKIVEIKGFSEKTATLLTKGRRKFILWLSKAKKYITITAKEQCSPSIRLKSSKLAGISVSFTGYRDKEQERLILSHGGEVVPFGGKTTVLLVSSTGKNSTKAQKAIDRGITVTSFDKLKVR